MDRRALVALAALGATAFCFITGETLPVGLLPQISASLHVSLSATGLLVTVYAVVVVLTSAPLTYATRNVPRRALLATVLTVFVLGTLASADAPSYGWLLAARIVTALAQALFWSVVAVTAAGLFRPELRARAVAGVLGGSSVGSVLGVPAGTWLAQQAGWRAPFLVLAGAGLLAFAAVVLLLPTSRPSESHAAAGAAPDPHRYHVLVATTVLSVSAFFTAFTYISPFLTRVSGLAHGDVALVLLVNGLATTTGVLACGALYGRRPRTATIVPVALLATALLGLYAAGSSAFGAIAFQSLDGLAIGGIAVTMQTGVLVVAPRSADIASSWFSASFNVGIASGPLIGALVLADVGLRSTPLVAGLLALGALTVLVGGTRWSGATRPVS